MAGRFDLACKPFHLCCLPCSRWVRLLFGREFPLQDLLVVWDALFADSITLDLVDYVFVAMLLYIRDARTFRLLLKNKSNTANVVALFVSGLVHCRCEIVYLKGCVCIVVSVSVIASNFQTCLGLLMHYPPLADINSLLQKALFLRDPKVSQRPPSHHGLQTVFARSTSRVSCASIPLKGFTLRICTDSSF